MALVPFPSEPVIDSFLEAFEFVGHHADVVANHYDDGVPWDSVLVGHTPGDAVREDFAYRRYRALQLHLRTTVALSWLNTSRDSLAPGWGRTPWPAEVAADPTFANPAVRRALKFWAAWAATYYEPDAISPGIEINFYARLRPDDWPNLVSLYAEVYDTLKVLRPGTAVFPTWQLDEMHRHGQWSLVTPLGSRMDALGVSLYPQLYGYTPATLPRGYLGDARTLTGVFGPLVVSETGYGDSSIAAYGVVGTPELQREYATWLVHQADSLGVRQLTWFFPTDAWGVIAAAGNPQLAAFGPMGLRRRDRTAKPALSVWDAAVARPYQAPSLP